MELKYRGIAYQASVSNEKAPEAERVGVYRGVSFQTQPQKASLRQPGEELIYRGVRYTR